MKPFQVSHSTITDWQSACRECLDGLDHGGATLGFIYATDHFAPHLSDILALCKERTGIPHWVGTVGVGICTTGHEFLDEPALAMLLTDIPESAYRILPGLTDLGDLLSHADAFTIGEQPAWFGIVHGDPRNPLVAELIGHVADRTETGFLVGGLTSSRGEHPQLADQISQGGLSGVLFTADVVVSTRLSQGVSPLGPRHTVSRCDRNIVMSLDDRPPLDVLKDDLGPEGYRQLEQGGDHLFVGLPTRDADTDDYLVRQLVGIDPDSRLIAVGDYLEPGQSLMFCRRDGRSAVKDMQRMLDDIKASLSGPPRGAVYYSCLGRGANLFGPDSEELKMISATLGDIPLVGFFANGEISRNRLYGWTGVLTLFA
jgi:small ligand-binding sensory domain FIST